MAMSKTRRIHQESLKRKYGYTSNCKPQPHSGVCINKKNANKATYEVCSEGVNYDIITDLVITMDPAKISDDSKQSIGIYLPKYKHYKTEDSTEELNMNKVHITFDALERLYKIAVELRKEFGEDESETYSREWALEKLRKYPGIRITHKSFDRNEYIYTELVDGLVYDENHYLFEDWDGDHDGMRRRVGDSWEKGWMLYNE